MITDGIRKARKSIDATEEINDRSRDSSIATTCTADLDDMNQLRIARQRVLSFNQVILEYPLPNPRNIVIKGEIKIND